MSEALGVPYNKESHEWRKAYSNNEGRSPQRVQGSNPIGRVEFRVVVAGMFHPGSVTLGTFGRPYTFTERTTVSLGQIAWTSVRVSLGIKVTECNLRRDVVRFVQTL